MLRATNYRKLPMGSEFYYPVGGSSDHWVKCVKIKEYAAGVSTKKYHYGAKSIEDCVLTIKSKTGKSCLFRVYNGRLMMYRRSNWNKIVYVEE